MIKVRPWYDVKMVLCRRFFFRFLDDPGGSGGDSDPADCPIAGTAVGCISAAAAAAAAAEGGITAPWLPPPPPPPTEEPVWSDLQSDKLYMYPASWVWIT